MQLLLINRSFAEEKDHAQTKASIHRSEKGITAVINKYNKLVEEMAGHKRDRKAPSKTVLPRLVDAKMIFRLDVDELLWQDDPGLGEEDCEELPRWLSDDNVREGIVAMLECDRCKEEIERLDHECTAMQQWLADELGAIQAALQNAQGMLVPFLESFSQHLLVTSCRDSTPRIPRLRLQSLFHRPDPHSC